MNTGAVMAAEATSSASDWAQFGLAGLVIFALFGLCIILLRMNKEERAEWRDAVTASNAEMATAVKDLTTAIHNMDKRQ